MNKKLLSVVLSATCVLALAACTGNNDDKVLTDSTHAAYCIAGPSQTTVDGTSIAWDYSAAGLMTASSRNQLAAIDADLAAELEDVKLSSLYIIQDVAIGGTAAGYNKLGYLEDGSLRVGTLWDPAKLGYLTVVLAYNYVNGIKPYNNQEIPNVGKITVWDDNRTVIMGPPTDFTKENYASFEF